MPTNRIHNLHICWTIWLNVRHINLDVRTDTIHPKLFYFKLNSGHFVFIFHLEIQSDYFGNSLVPFQIVWLIIYKLFYH